MVWTIFGSARSPRTVYARTLVVGIVALDPATGSVAVGGWLVRAPDREAQLMEQLMRHPGGVLAPKRWRAACKSIRSASVGWRAVFVAASWSTRSGHRSSRWSPARIPTSLRAPGRRRVPRATNDRARSRHAVARRRLARWTATPANGNAD